MWYVYDQDSEKAHGPYSLQDLNLFYQQGSIDLNTYIVSENDEDCVLLDNSPIRDSVTKANDPSASDSSVIDHSDKIQSGISVSIAGVTTCMMRVDESNIIQYINSAFAKEFGVEVESIEGESLSSLALTIHKEIFRVLVLPPLDETITHEVNTGSTIYEIRVTNNHGQLDIAIRDISSTKRFRQYVEKYVSSDLANLTEEELESFKFPERRYMSVSFTDLRGFTAMSETLSPEEVRSTMNDYLEAIIGAIENNHSTVDKIVGDEVMALYGAPRHYKDHAFRAIITACEQIQRLKKVQNEYELNGKVMPNCGIGINTGDMVLGNIGGQSRQDYTVLGAPVNLAARLCDAAADSKILMTQSTLDSALNNLPNDWQVKEQIDPDYELVIEKLRGKTEAISPLPGNLHGKSIFIGPDVEENIENAVYSFTYIYCIKVKGVRDPLPVILAKQETGNENAVVIPSQTETITPETKERIFGKYRLLKRIGRGGMGEVWQARDNFGNTLAIKMLLSGSSASETEIKRFKREGEAMARLQHPNLCRIYEVGQYDKVHFIAMEYIEGVELTSILEFKDQKSSVAANRTGSVTELIESVRVQDSISSVSDSKSDSDSTKEFSVLPVQQTLSIIDKVCEAVQFAHENGVLHRDLKPSNIMIRKNGEPVVMDFGLAQNQLNVDDKKALTVVGEVVGTIEYMAPEQVENSSSVDERSDVYSLGAILYQMLSGRKHYESTGNLLTDGNNLKVLIPESIKKWNRSIDTDIDIITQKAIRCDKTDRYVNVKAFQDDLRRYQNGEAISARSFTFTELLWKWCIRNKAVSVATLIFLVLSLIGASFSFWSITQEKDAAIAARKIAEEEKLKAEHQAYVSTLSAASSKINQGEKLFAKNLLVNTPTHLRGIEWGMLFQESSDWILSDTPYNSSSTTAFVKIPRTNKILLSTYSKIYLYNLETLKVEETIDTSAECIDVNKDGSFAILLDKNGSMQLLDIDSRKVTKQIEIGNSSGLQIKISPNGKYVAISFSNGESSIWSIDDFKKVYQIYSAGEEKLRGFEFTDDATLFAENDKSWILKVSLSDGQWNREKLNIKELGIYHIRDLKYDVTNERLAILHGQGITFFEAVINDKLIKAEEYKLGSHGFKKFNIFENRILVYDRERFAVYDLENEDEVFNMSVDAEHIYGCFCLNKEFVYVVTEKGIKLIRIVGRENNLFKSYNDVRGRSIIQLPHNNGYATVNYRNEVNFMDKNFLITDTLKIGCPGDENSLLINEDNSRLFVKNDPESICEMYDLSNGERIYRANKQILGLENLNDKTKFMYVDRSKRQLIIQRWDKLESSEICAENVQSAIYSKTKNVIFYTKYNDEHLYQFELDSRLSSKIYHFDDINHKGKPLLIKSNSEEYLFLKMTRAKTVLVWNIENQTFINTLNVSVGTRKVIHQGRHNRFISIGPNKALRIWDSRTGDELFVYKLPDLINDIFWDEENDALYILPRANKQGLKKLDLKNLPMVDDDKIIEEKNMQQWRESESTKIDWSIVEGQGTLFL